jgi:XTP/dITP diphosphohydrolase
VPPGPHLDRLVSVFERLRAPDGCAWDRERTLVDLGKHLREECDEVVGAIAAVEAGPGGAGGADPRLADAVREECGDLLANLVFTVQIARERGWFDMEDVARGACEKIVRRHPHVFGDAKAETPEEVEALWQRIKAGERAAAAGGGGGSPGPAPGS